jgi:hypothetical protein
MEFARNNPQIQEQRKIRGSMVKGIKGIKGLRGIGCYHCRNLEKIVEK